MQAAKWIAGHPVRLVAVLGGVACTLGAAKLASPYVMRKLCDKAFDKMDLNHNGFLDEVELQLGVYEVYNLVNKRFPGWSDPPSRAQILQVMDQYDVNKDSQFDKEEFSKFVNQILVGGGDQMFKRMGKSCTKDVGVIPAATPIIKGALGLSSIPDRLVTPVLGSVTSIVTGMK